MVQRFILVKPTILFITLIIADHTKNAHGFFGSLTGWFSLKSSELQSRENIHLVKKALNRVGQDFFDECELLQLWTKNWIIGKSYWVMYTCEKETGLEENCMLHFLRKFGRLVTNEMPICKTFPKDIKMTQPPARAPTDLKPKEHTITCPSLKPATADGECECDCVACCDDYCACD